MGIERCTNMDSSYLETILSNIYEQNWTYEDILPEHRHIIAKIETYQILPLHFYTKKNIDMELYYGQIYPMYSMNNQGALQPQLQPVTVLRAIAPSKNANPVQIPPPKHKIAPSKNSIPVQIPPPKPKNATKPKETIMIDLSEASPPTPKNVIIVREKSTEKNIVRSFNPALGLILPKKNARTFLNRFDEIRHKMNLLN